MVGSDSVTILILLVFLVIALFFGIYPVFSNVAKNKCIIQQHTLLNGFSKTIELVKERDSPVENKSFMVMSCTDCIWYDSLNSQWKIKYKDESEINKSISYNVVGVAANCVSCNEPENCANMVKDTTYNFEVGEDYVRCTNCPDSPNLCGYSVLFSPRVEVADDLYDPVDEAEPIALVSYRDILYLFYHKEGTDDIYYRTSSDGKSWGPENLLTDGTRTYGFPSAVVFEDELYVGYSGLNGGWEIFVKKFDGTWSDVGVLTSTNVGQDGGSYFAVYDGELYLFYHHEDHHIKYMTCGSNCGAPGSWGAEQEAVPSGTHVYPSAIEYDGKLHLSYSKQIGLCIPDPGIFWNCRWSIYYRNFDGSSWSAEEEIAVNENNNGNPHLIVYDEKLYVFYHGVEGSSLATGTGKVLYKAYDGGWQKECGAAGGKGATFAAIPAPTWHLHKFNLCFTQYDGDWKIMCQ